MDNFEKKIVESKKAIMPSTINNPDKLYKDAHVYKRPWYSFLKSSLVLKYATIVLLVFLVTISSLSLLQRRGGEKDEKLPPNNENISTSDIIQATSLDEIRSLINNSQSSSFDGVEEDAGASVPSPGTDSYYQSSSKDFDINHSFTTNIQVENVDEADIVKVNGDYIYYVTKAYNNYSYTLNTSTQYSKNALYILKANNEKLDIVKEFSFENKEEVIADNGEAKVIEKRSFIPRDILFTSEYLILNMSTTINTYVEYQGTKRYSNYDNYTEIVIYDIESYEQVKNIKVPGNMVDTRLIGNQLYIISNYYDYKNRNDDKILPVYMVDDFGIDVEVSRIYYCPSFGVNVNSYVVIFRITLKDEITIEDLYFLAPSINKVYVNENAIYLIRTYSNQKVKENNVVTNWPTSKIIVINIENELVFDGLIEVKGTINDRYWVDEYNGYLRIVTTGTKYTYKTIKDKYIYDQKNEIFNFLTIFKKNSEGKWEEVSSITSGLGEEGESVKSARFNKNTATVVTFRQTDPLYCIDLTDHLNPVITSELKISGFTVYQHPYKDNYVIGFGYETNSNGSTIGYKIALFDISNKEKIKQVGKEIVFNSVQYRSFGVINNPKELFLDLDNNIFGFGVIKRTDENHTYPDGFEYGYYHRSCYYLFEIDLEKANPISIIKEEIKDVPYSMRNYKVLERMVFIKDKYYLLAMDEVLIYQLSNEGINLINKQPLV